MLKNSLKKLRESNGLTQKEVAEKLNGSLYNEIAHLKNLRKTESLKIL